MGDHARLSPSKAAMWAECAQSVAANAIHPDKGGSEYAVLGTTAHWGGEQTLKNGHWSSVEMVGQVCPETGQKFADDMVEAVDTYVNYIRQRLEEMGEGTEMHVEVRVNPGKLISRDDCWGTADCVLVNDIEMEVIDYKNGSGVSVDAGDPQFALYGLGGIHEFGAKNKVTTTVVQPRKAHQDGPVRSIEWSREEMEDWREFFTSAAEATDDPDAPFTPGEDTCRWCKAKATCAAHGDYALRQAQVYFSDTPLAQADPAAVLEEVRRNTTQRAASDLDLSVVVTVLDSAPMIRGWLDAVESYAMAMLQAGHEVPGYKLVRGRSNRKWDPELNEEDLEKKLKNLGLKKAEYTDQRIKSVTQIEAILSKRDLSDIKKRNFQKLVVKPEGKVTIAPGSDPRSPLDRSPEGMFEAQEKQDIQPNEVN